MKNNKGITLISLISSIVLLIILAAATIATSMNAYKQMKLEGAKTELEELQKKVDEIASDYQTYLKEPGDPLSKSYVNYFNSRYGNNEAPNPFEGMLISANSGKITTLPENHQNNIDVDSIYTFYFEKDALMKYFGLKGIDKVIVDFSTRTVYSVEGIKDSNSSTVYYTPKDWGSDSVVPKTGITALATIGTVVSQKNVNSYDISIETNGKINNKISEIYLIKNNKYIKVDNFRDVSDDNTKTKIKFSVDASIGSYDVKLIDEIGNVYEKSNAVTLN